MIGNTTLLKGILALGGVITAFGAVPRIISASSVDSKLPEKNDSNQKQSRNLGSLFGGDLKDKNGKLGLDRVCFYYDKGTSKDKILLLGYSSGEGIGKGGCKTLESSIGEDERQKGVLHVEIPVGKLQGGDNAVWRISPEGEILGCLEVSWWKRDGWLAKRGQKVVVGDSFRIDKSGCTNSTFKQTNGVKDRKKCSGACQEAWKNISDKNSVGWDRVWSSNYAKVDRKNYAEIDSTKVIWRLEQK